MNNTANVAAKMESNAMPEQWVETHGDYLFNFAVGQLRDASVAEDLVQDTFLAALKAPNASAANLPSAPGWSASCVTKFATTCVTPAANALSVRIFLHRTETTKRGMRR